MFLETNAATVTKDVMNPSTRHSVFYQMGYAGFASGGNASEWIALISTRWWLGGWVGCG